MTKGEKETIGRRAVEKEWRDSLEVKHKGGQQIMEKERARKVQVEEKEKLELERREREALKLTN